MKNYVPGSTVSEAFSHTELVSRVREVLSIPAPRSPGFVDALPFSLHDATAGSETELQAAVAGTRETVDLPVTIQESN